MVGSLPTANKHLVRIPETQSCTDSQVDYVELVILKGILFGWVMLVSRDSRPENCVHSSSTPNA
eukprot:6341642-Amphidinium_carterae.1